MERLATLGAITAIVATGKLVTAATPLAQSAPLAAAAGLAAGIAIAIVGLVRRSKLATLARAATRIRLASLARCRQGSARLDDVHGRTIGSVIGRVVRDFPRWRGSSKGFAIPESVAGAHP